MDSYNIVVCNNCGFIYADNIPSQNEFNEYYARQSKYEFNYEDGQISVDYKKYFERVAKFLVPYLKDKKARILDIGCASGDLLAILKSKGYSNLTGIEPSPDCIIKANELYGIKIITDNIYDFETSEQFDLVIISAVLEHLMDLTGAIEKIKSLLKDDGLIFVEVPDIERFDSYIPAPFQQFNMEHLNFFSRYSLENLLSKFSFTTIKVQHEECEADNVTMPDIYFLSQKSNNHNVGIEKDNISEFCVKKYITKCSEISLELNTLLQNKLSNIDRIIVWGVGTHTKQLLDTCLDISKVTYFVDSNSRYKNKKIKGKDIILPNEIDECIPILISTHSYQQEIIHQIKEVLKLNNEVIAIYE